MVACCSEVGVDFAKWWHEITDADEKTMMRLLSSTSITCIKGKRNAIWYNPLDTINRLAILLLCYA